ncbi:prolyl oligopeptidase family serine peptidase [Mesorhizobium muleiense]|uniref:dienelactone hydrolase family protein n=1 Tax=Mesorhizobium muleiense TaxID=1004279 RepID=UPI001F1693D6|nr:prolyl oligopeptidase family serine peptidase [Mesorhizobium muleiense]MCF6120362.1 prolyl oligopeptidase family serine peptidase [Mesorhizobium muleiense]
MHARWIETFGLPAFLRKAARLLLCGIAYGALEFLTTLGFVDSRRVALMGFSAGGIAVLQAVQLGAAEALMKQKFQAAIAYYPSCSVTSGEMAVPTLILVGERDDWTPASACRKMMERRSGKGTPPNSSSTRTPRTHSDAENLKTAISSFGHFLRYNELAANRSFQDSHVFLSETLGH